MPKRKPPMVPADFALRPAVRKAHHANLLMLKRFAKADEGFAARKLVSSNGNKFETAQESLREDLGRIHRLLSAGARKTALELALGFKLGPHPYSFASAVFSRNFRMRIIKRFVQIAKRYELLTSRTITLVSCKWKLEPEELSVATLAKVKKRVRRVLDDAGMTKLDGIALAQIDLSFDSTSFWPHFHIVVAGTKCKAIPRIREIMKTHAGDGLQKPVVVKKVEELEGALLYATKSFAKVRPTRSDEEGSIYTRIMGTRLPLRHEVKWLKTLHRAKASDLLLLQGARLGQGGLAPLDSGGSNFMRPDLTAVAGHES